MNLKNKLTTLDGKEMDTTVGKIVAQVLTGEKNADPARAYALGLDAFKEEADWNDSDLEFITAALKKSEAFTPLAIGQVLQEIAKKKEDLPTKK